MSRQVGRGVWLALAGLLVGGAGGWALTQWQLQESTQQLKQTQWSKEQLQSELLVQKEELKRANQQLQLAGKQQKEAQQYQEEISELKQQLTRLQNTLAEVREQNRSRIAVASQQAASQSNRDEQPIQAMQQKLEQARIRIAELSQEHEQTLAENQNLDEQLRRTSEQRQATAQQLAETSQQQETLQKQLETLKETQERMTGELASAQAQRGELESELHKRQQQLSEQQSKLVEANSSLQQLAQRRASLEAEIQQLNHSLERLKQEREQDRLQFQQLKQQLSSQIANRDVEIEQLRNNTTVIRIGGDILFDSGSVNLSQQGRSTLDSISQTLQQIKERHISIEGHTDNRPIGKSLLQRYPSNWELSAARAASAVRYLLKAKPDQIDPTQLSAVGFADTRAVADNSTDEGKRKNRRIEIRLLPRAILEPAMQTSIIQASGEKP